MRRRRLALAGAVAGLALATVTAAPAAARPTELVVLQVRPVTAGVPFVLHGRRRLTDARGRVVLPTTSAERARGWTLLRARLRIPARDVAPGVRARFARWVGSTPTVVLQRPVRLVLRDPEGQRLGADEAPEVVVRGSDGARHVLQSGRPAWLPSVRAVVTPRGAWRRQAVSYTVQEARAHGVNVVHRNQQRFTPARTSRVDVRALFFTARVRVRDAIFPRAAGRAVVVRFPDGHSERRALPSSGRIVLAGLARGDYEISVDGPGLSFARPVNLSRSQDVELRVITRLDALLAAEVLLDLVLALALGRRLLRRDEEDEDAGDEDGDDEPDEEPAREEELVHG